MNAVDRIRRDHRTVRGHLRDLRRLHREDVERRAEAFYGLKRELEILARVEEALFYPAVQGADGPASEWVRDALQVHDEVERVLAEMAALEVDEPAFDRALDNLEAMVEQHLEEEEEVLLPRARSRMDRERLLSLGEEMESLRRVLGLRLGAR
ncbi:MAG TPA: hemerythrin domain-containing protein [Planctomycetota bacterium]|nr:hemerythrin domain-containing protein [Planctomycetota bacterium]